MVLNGALPEDVKRALLDLALADDLAPRGRRVHSPPGSALELRIEG